MGNREFIKAFAIVMVVSLGYTAALAGPKDADPLVYYRAYESALVAGDTHTAATNADLAWQTAEQRWEPSDPNLAGLAMNAAWMFALDNDIAKSVAPAKRAVALAALAGSAYTREEADFLLSYGEFRAADPAEREKLVKRLSDAAKAVERNWPDFMVVDAFNIVAAYAIKAGRYNDAIDLSNRSLGEVRRLIPNDKDRLSNALLMRAIATFSSNDDWEVAVSDVIDARLAYGPSRTDRDREFATLAVWHLAIEAALRSSTAYKDISSSNNSILKPKSWRKMDAQEELSLRDTNSDAKCTGTKRLPQIGRDIQFPAKAIQNGVVAGVIVAHDIDPQGFVQNLEILASIPSEIFDREALDSVKTWRFSVPESEPLECRSSRQTFVSFVYEN